MTTLLGTLTTWQQVWRQGIAPQLSTEALQALARALRENSPHLVQGTTTVPAPLACFEHAPVECGCPIAYAVWQGDYQGAASVGRVEEEFARICFEADHRLGEPAAIRHFLCQVDDWDRSELRRALLPEVERTLAQRRGCAVA